MLCFDTKFKSVKLRGIYFWTEFDNNFDETKGNRIVVQ